jgi:predicted DNA-binding antitoxin AbrB/MazE fold protein
VSQTLEAIFDGDVLRPEQPLGLKKGTRVRITVEALSSPTTSISQSFLQTARSLQLDGPQDWSEKIDEYLYDSEA